MSTLKKPGAVVLAAAIMATKAAATAVATAIVTTSTPKAGSEDPAPSQPASPASPSFWSKNETKLTLAVAFLQPVYEAILGAIGKILLGFFMSLLRPLRDRLRDFRRRRGRAVEVSAAGKSPTCPSHVFVSNVW
ncbi:hypothetical protein QBC47DRAFT_356737 [Echria macrotheca]|uniref:Uncharacterized protein n=1 Tax=Echria macrotheca TaxID=438768 RepID=A0AAJ0FEJ4_9PEZI|nr:hypothetical protein QBC47DRAFT_356737 [Echria macrotheca]